MSNEENLDTQEDIQSDETETTAEDVQSDAPAGLESQLAEARKKADENWDQLVRAKAEMENLRRRNQRDLESAHKFAIEKFVTELLPVKDSLELGISASEQENASVEQLREGMELTLKMLSQAFEKFNVAEIHPEGDKFNPEHHQAMAMIEHDTVEANTVLNVMQKGYLLNDRLVRPAMVTVSKGK